MKNKIFKGLCLFTIIGGIVMVESCKPTEKGYKAAYDAAVNKRENALKDLDTTNAVTGIQSVDGPMLRTFEGKNYYYMAENLKPYPADENKSTKGYNVVVALFKMPTNSNSLASDLVKEGYKADVVKYGSDEYYVRVANFENLKEAVEFSQEYENKNTRPYLGLVCNAPVLIFSR